MFIEHLLYARQYIVSNDTQGTVPVLKEPVVVYEEKACREIIINVWSVQ